MSQNLAHSFGTPRISYLLDQGWECTRRHGSSRWHRGQRAAGDRYWSEYEAFLIAKAEEHYGRTLWPGDKGWPVFES